MQLIGSRDALENASPDAPEDTAANIVNGFRLDTDVFTSMP